MERNYDGIFRDPRMFDSRKAFTAAGFDVHQAASHNVMVGTHPTESRYLFKKYCRDVPLDEQEENYRDRLWGARKIQQLIDKHRLRHLVVPHKWLYELPERFSRRHTTYVLVAERLSVLSADESARRYRTINPEILDDLCRVLFHFRGFDAAIHNLPFTTSGQIAFIDTESCTRSPRPGTRVFKRIDRELPMELRKRIRRTFERIEDDE
jgi:hypothetical protein